jgi:predicted  nucleic acid-binding Zn-ribbon protein
LEFQQPLQTFIRLESALRALREELDRRFTEHEYKQVYDSRSEAWEREGQLEEELTRSRVRVEMLEEDLKSATEERDRALEALREMVCVAKFAGWEEATTGRQIIFQQARAALAQHPAPKLSPAPEIRHQLRDWHHVTCSNFGGGACSCLDARENLIRELTPNA